MKKRILETIKRATVKTNSLFIDSPEVTVWNGIIFNIMVASGE